MRKQALDPNIPPPLPSPRGVSSAIGLWLLFVATFPAGLAVGYLLAHGQDAAGQGIGIGLGMLLGLAGGVVMAVFVSRSMVRLLPQVAGKLLAILAWIILASFWWMIFCTPTGDRLAEWLENL